MKLRTILPLTVACGLTVSAALAANPSAAAGNVSLYLSQDTSKPAFMQLSANDASVTTAVPVMDATKAAEGWHTVVLPGPISGYVPTKTSHKDLTINPGTPVHAAPDEKSPVIGQTPTDPLLTIKSPGVDWSEVSLPGPVVAYFQSSALKPSTTTAAVTAAPAPVAPVINLPPTRPNGAPPATTAVSTVQVGKQADPADVGHFYYGVLKQRTDTKIGGPTNAKYVLYSTKDQLLALVDLNDVVLPNPLVVYLNKSVRIYGTVYPESSLPFAVIHATTLQAN